MKTYINHTQGNFINYGASPEMVSKVCLKFTLGYLINKGYKLTWNGTTEYFTTYGSLSCTLKKGNIEILYGLYYMGYPPRVISIKINGLLIFCY